MRRAHAEPPSAVPPAIGQHNDKIRAWANAPRVSDEQLNARSETQGPMTDLHEQYTSASARASARTPGGSHLPSGASIRTASSSVSSPRLPHPSTRQI